MANIKTIFGAPGCGKTTRLMEILENELKRTAPDKIAFVSFTRKGTYEGVERARKLFGYEEKDLPYFRTLHSIAFRTCGFSVYDMISRKDYKAFSKAMGMNFVGYYNQEFTNADDRYLFIHFLKRNNPKVVDNYTNDMSARLLREVEHNYIRYKSFSKTHDFEDLIERFIAMGEPLPVKIAIIDEAQDLTTLQWQMTEIAFKDCDRIYIAGDDDQAIYEWSGADINYFLNIKGEREILDKSYRLQKNILELAQRISGMIKQRVEKKFEPINDEGDIKFYNSLNELKLNKDESYYFLCRNNWFLHKAKTFLREHAEVFLYKQKPSYDEKQTQAIKVFERARKSINRITESDKMLLKLHLKGSLNLNKCWYQVLNFDNDTMAYYKDLIKYKTDLNDRRITVSTIHGVKGGEADNVILFLDITQAVCDNMFRNPDSEFRCLYVACTRAKKHLHIIHTATKNGYDNYIKFNGGRK